MAVSRCGAGVSTFLKREFERVGQAIRLPVNMLEYRRRLPHFLSAMPGQAGESPAPPIQRLS
jgi:hypothetical protein